MLSLEQGGPFCSQRTISDTTIQMRLRAYYRGLSQELALQPERIHSVPKRQEEFNQMVEKACFFSCDANVLELACGVGFWTQKMSAYVSSIYATDICEEALDIGRRRVESTRVQFAVADAMALSLSAQQHFNRVFGGFWLSHIKRELLPAFFQNLHSLLGRGTEMLFVENEYPNRDARPFESVTHKGDTFELRQLKDGSTHFVLKNYFTDRELMDSLGPQTINAQIERTAFYWSLRYQVT